MIRVAIVDDHPIVRAGLRAVLETAKDIEVVSEGDCGADALRLVEETQPDVLVLDINLPDVNGFEVSLRLKERMSPTRILILTVHRERASVFGMLEAGVSGYVVKEDALETLACAIRAVARGENWLSPSVAKEVVRKAVSVPPAYHKKSAGTGDPVETLTPREVEVLRLLSEGMDNNTIARQLVLTTRTVQNHVSNIYGKLGINSRAEAVLWAIRFGIVDPPKAENRTHEE